MKPTYVNCKQISFVIFLCTRLHNICVDEIQRRLWNINYEANQSNGSSLSEKEHPCWQAEYLDDVRDGEGNSISIREKKNPNRQTSIIRQDVLWNPQWINKKGETHKN